MSNVPEVVVFNDGDHLAQILKDFKGYSQFTLVTITEPNCTKKARGNVNPADKGRPFSDFFKGKIYKTAKRYASLGYDYEKSVQNRLAKEGKDDAAAEFEGQSLPWGDWWDGSKVVLKHHDKFYIRITYLNANGAATKYIYHYDDGDEITGDDLEILKKDFLPLKKSDSRQGTDDEIMVNSIKAENIMEMRVGGKRLVHRSVIAREKMNKL